MKLPYNHKEIIQCVAEGMTAEETAKTLFKAPGTIKTQLDKIRFILDARSSAHMVAIAIRKKIIE